jgi:hypothetical protein
MTYLVLLDNITGQHSTILWSGVSFPVWWRTKHGYVIEHDGEEYVIPSRKAIETNRLTRLDNVSAFEHRYNQRADKTQDYITVVRESMGIDMRANYSPQYRDGKNPHKDKKNDKDTRQQPDDQRF